MRQNIKGPPAMAPEYEGVGLPDITQVHKGFKSGATYSRPLPISRFDIRRCVYAETEGIFEPF